jgi:hypothetical protein
MPRTGWYNENEFRDYPFIYRPTGSVAALELPQATIVDFGVILYPVLGFDNDVDAIYLAEISRTGGTFTFVFANTHDSSVCTFDRSLTDPEFSVSWNGSGTVDTCTSEPYWEAFLTTGLLTDLANLLPDGDVLTFPARLWTIEPGRIQNLRDNYLNSLNLANTARTLATEPCSSASAAEQEVHVYAECIRGDVRFKPGFNATIRQEDATKTLVFGGAVGEGEGEPCEEIPLYPGELPQPGSRYLSGGPACNEVLLRLNGIGGKDVYIHAGPGFTVAGEPTTHTVTITYTGNDFITPRT